MANKTRPNRVIFRLSDEELELLKKKIDEAGTTQQEYLQKAALGMSITNTDGIKEIYPELKRQGVNLNQIAKKLNETGFVDYKHDLPNTMKEVREVWQLLKQYLQKQV